MSEKNNNPQAEALKVAMEALTKQHGKGTIMTLGDADQLDVEVIPTSALNLDIALGVGGLPTGRIVEIYGPESSGKTTLCYHVMANAQKQGKTCVFIDTEHALDPVYAKRIGLDTDNLIVSQPDTGEQALDIAEVLINSGGVGVVVIDSVAGLIPEAELQGEMGDHSMGLQARMMGKFLRKISGAARKSNTLVIFTNQLRMKIGVMFGSPETTPGGRALPFAASVRMDIRRIETLKKGTDSIGNKVRVKIIKNKVAAPFKQAEFDIMFGTGISRSGCVLDMAVEYEVVKKAGAFYSYGEDRLAQGRDKAKAYLEENPLLLDEIEGLVRDEIAKRDAPEEVVPPVELDEDGYPTEEEIEEPKEVDVTADESDDEDGEK